VELLKQHLDHGVFALLGLMSFIAITCAVERWIYFRRFSPAEFDHPELLKIALTARLTTIASVASNAPYVGLLGTVLGILVTFHEIGTGGAFDTRAVMQGLALALKATALGLVVAIPSMLLYNALVRRVEELTAEWQASYGVGR